MTPCHGSDSHTDPLSCLKWSSDHRRGKSPGDRYQVELCIFKVGRTMRFGATELCLAGLKKTDLVIDSGDPRSQPCCSFSFFPFRPRTYPALKDGFASQHLNGDAFCIDLCTPDQGVLDLPFQVGGGGERLHGD